MWRPSQPLPVRSKSGAKRKLTVDDILMSCRIIWMDTAMQGAGAGAEGGWAERERKRLAQQNHKQELKFWQEETVESGGDWEHQHLSLNGIGQVWVPAESQIYPDITVNAGTDLGAKAGPLALFAVLPQMDLRLSILLLILTKYQGLLKISSLPACPVHCNIFWALALTVVPRSNVFLTPLRH